MSTSLKPTSPILALPTELHIHISSYLPYPDLLALKHTSPYFYQCTTTTVYDRVDWLLDRPQLGLPLPQTRCIMKTDAQFCANKEVRLFMKRRRRHLECVGRTVCLISGSNDCPGVKTLGLNWRSPQVASMFRYSHWRRTFNELPWAGILQFIFAVLMLVLAWRIWVDSSACFRSGKGHDSPSGLDICGYIFGLRERQEHHLQIH